MRENVVAYFHFKWTKNRGAGQGIAEWGGLPLAELMRLVRPRPRAIARF
jgi:hypothetical protein